MVAFSAQDIPNRFDFSISPKIYEYWESKRFFHSEPDPSRKPFTIVIPPPNVTGALHLGHALNNTLQDVLIRYKRMKGFNTLWIPGTDHAGIATQAVVERRIFELEKKSRHDLGREELVRRIWDWKDQYEARILGQLKRLGSSCDWERTRFTLDERCARAVRRTFFDLFAKQWIYKGKRLVNWDTFLQTAVSDDEVFHETTDGSFWHFKYPVIDPKPGEPEFVTIATTRPETMLGDTAVAVHPDPEKALNAIEAELKEKLKEAPGKDKPAIQEQLDQIAERRTTMLPQLIQLRDMALAGRKLMLPLVDREIPLVADPWAKPELGSGCVKITPAHDPNDYEVGIRQNLPFINILNSDGTMNEVTGEYVGLSIPKARQAVVNDLDGLQLLEKIEDRKIELAYSDRSKTPIEPYLADQWFIKMDDLAQSAMDAVKDGRVKIFPQRYANGYVDWLSEKRDWPVSRQLWWGHQIPIWSQECAHKEDHDALIAKLDADPDIQSHKVNYQIERDVELEAAEKTGTIQGAARAAMPYSQVHVCIADEDDKLAAKYETLGFVREQDVLDTWFSSALWPHSTLGWPEHTPELEYYYPTSTLITSRDIITLWVARMVLAGLNNMGEIPFREVFIHPTILDGLGERMSKSKGNGVDPLDVIDRFGADSLRFGLAYLTTETQDVRMPVQFECPHCNALIDQTKKNRQQPRIECKKCGEAFSTQWAESEEDKALPRGSVVSERFELGRNFCNKLWNAARFTMMNLEGYTPGTVSLDELQLEDRWILSRLHTVTKEVERCYESYGYADAARATYDFAWDEFCNFYVEILKERFQDEKQRPTAQRVITYVLDSMLRLLHPIIPFITEEIWQTLGKIAPQRGLEQVSEATESIMESSWPEIDGKWEDSTIETQFSVFQETLGSLREIRSRQNIGPKDTMEFVIRCDDAKAKLLGTMSPYFLSMNNARSRGLGKAVEVPETNATITAGDMEIFVDLKDFIDVEAEIQRNEKLETKLAQLVTSKEKKLSNDSFVSRAPADIVAKERESLEQARQELERVINALARLRESAAK
ncbi:valine--tRNA ligase [Bremerella cremea]|uniref:Valine--tRNA ligase n=1 Tax=Bremerella cremea TaxID=1031537 RepID=A0A368KV54_9BACT|nr:valine--tRNA ligase [Bremerella cremea]RCS54201.1 valine--tRNA ligase [Bremerella cremea]